MKKSESFLKGKYWKNEEFRRATKKAAKRTEKREGKRIADSPEARIENYLKRFTDIFERENEKQRERGIKALQRLLYKKYVIKPEQISDQYIKGILFGNFAEQKGYNRNDLKNPDIKQALLNQFHAEIGQDFAKYVVPEEKKQNVREMIINDQKARIDSWLSYITSPEAKNYPAAYLYWAFAEILQLGSYDDERKIYNKRTETTTAPFPELDQQALALILDEIRRKQKGEPSQIIPKDPQSQNEFSKRLKRENFGRLYAFMQEYLKSLRLPTERLVVTDGEWKVFPRGSDAKEVVRSLEGFHTQWCIAGEGTAANYLSHSELQIYFSKDARGNNSIPRACIVYSKDKGIITEIRGIISDEISKQHLDDYIVPIVEKKLNTLPGGEKWSGAMRDMKRLANIHIKYLRGEELKKDDLRFLYEIDGKIKSTGYDRDSRIKEILNGRDIKGDLSFVLNTTRDRISTTQEEALSGNIKYHYGYLYLITLTSAKGITLPESVGGDLYLGSLTSTEGLTLPKSVGGDLYLKSLTSAAGLTLPESVGGNIYLESLTSAEKDNLRKQYPHLRFF